MLLIQLKLSFLAAKCCQERTFQLKPLNRIEIEVYRKKNITNSYRRTKSCCHAFCRKRKSHASTPWQLKKDVTRPSRRDRGKDWNSFKTKLSAWSLKARFGFPNMGTTSSLMMPCRLVRLF